MSKYIVMGNTIHKMFRENSYEFIITSLAQCIYLMQNVVQNKIFTSFFETPIFGKWSLLVSAYTLISMLPFSAIDQGIYKVAYRCKEEKKEQELYTVVGLIYSIGFIIYSIIFFITSEIQGKNFFASGYSVAFALYAFSEIVKNTLLLIDNAFRKRHKVLLIRIFGIGSRTILFLLLHALGVFSIKNVLWVLVMTNAAILLTEKEYFLNISIKSDIISAIAIFKSILMFSAPLMTWAIFGWMQNMISRWYIDAILDLQSVAMYSVLTTLSYFVPNAVYTILNAYVMPIVFERNESFTRKKLLLYLGAVGSVMIFYWLFVVVAGKYLIIMLTDAKYLPMTTFLPYTTFSAILYVLSMLSTVEIYRRGQTKKLLVSTIFPGFFMATFGYFLIKHFGFIGAIINYMSGHIIYTVLTLLVVFDKKNLY